MRRPPSAAPPPDAPSAGGERLCADCGKAPADPCFTVCEPCWDKAYGEERERLSNLLSERSTRHRDNPVRALLNKLDCANMEIGTLRSEVKAAGAERDTAQADLATAREQLRTIARACCVGSDQTASPEDAGHEHALGLVNTVLQDLGTARAALATAEAEVERQHGTIDGLRGHVLRLNKLLETTSDECDAARTELERERTALATAERERDQLRDWLRGLTAQAQAGEAKDG